MLKDFKTLLVALDGHILTVQLNTPDGNAISGRVLDELLVVLAEAENDPDVRVLVLSGAGDDFCKGGDRGEFATLLAEDPSGGTLRALANKARRVCQLLATTETATIAKLHGSVIGAGVGLAVFCDLRVGATDCRFRLPELGLGVPPAWGGILPRLLAEVGAAKVRELLLTADEFDAAEAHSLSILTKVVPPSELDTAVSRWTRPLIRRDAAALRTTKAMLNANTTLTNVGLFDADLLTASMTRKLARRH